MLVNVIKLGRPQFLLLGLAVYGFGAAWAAAFGSQVSWLRLSWGALVVLLAQLSVSYSNDYFDQKMDQPESVTPLSGGSGVLIQHPELRQPARLIGINIDHCLSPGRCGFPLLFPFALVVNAFRNTWQPGRLVLFCAATAFIREGMG